MYAVFDCLVVGIVHYLGQSSPWPKYTQYGTVKKNHVLLSNCFSSSNMSFIRLFLAIPGKKNRGSPCSFDRKGAFISLSDLV